MVYASGCAFSAIQLELLHSAGVESPLMNRKLILIAAILTSIVGATAFAFWNCKPRPAPLISESELASHIGSRVSIRGTLLLRFKLSPLVEVGKETILLSNKPTGLLDGQPVIVTGILGQRIFTEPAAGEPESAGPLACVMFTVSDETLQRAGQ